METVIEITPLSVAVGTVMKERRGCCNAEYEVWTMLLTVVANWDLYVSLIVP